MPLVFLFPGQSSVRPDAIARARQAHPAAEALARRAAAVLGAADAHASASPSTAAARPTSAAAAGWACRARAIASGRTEL